MAESSAQYDTIISKLGETYEKGHSSGDLYFFASTTSTHVESGVEFDIRLCPSLANKEKAIAAVKPDHSPQTGGYKVNPFLPPYKEGLYVGELAEEDEAHVVLLNKYSVVEHHFLLVTKEYKLQTSPLTPAELTAAYRILLAAKRAGRSFLMFFNCGEPSGSSQGHKHLQFLPLLDSNGPPIEKLAHRQQLETQGKAFSISSLPYANHVIRLPTSTLANASTEETSDILRQAYIRLLDLTIETFMHQASDHLRSPTAYNVLMTLSHLHMIPRGEGEYNLPTGEKLPINALGFAGLLMVKSEEEGEALRNEGVLKVLKAVGLEDAHGESCSKIESGL